MEEISRLFCPCILWFRIYNQVFSESIVQIMVLTTNNPQICVPTYLQLVGYIIRFFQMYPQFWIPAT